MCIRDRVGDYLEEKKVKGAAVQMYGPAFLEYLQKVPTLKGNSASIATVIALYEAGPGGSAYAPEPNLFFQALTERDPVKKRALIKDHISTPLDSLRDFGADQDAFEAIDDFARHLHTAAYSLAARMVLKDFVRLSRPENEPRADDVPVSYTHLDVYKRQKQRSPRGHRVARRRAEA